MTIVVVFKLLSISTYIELSCPEISCYHKPCPLNINAQDCMSNDKIKRAKKHEEGCACPKN